MVSDNIRHTSLSRKAGRGLIRALRGLFGSGPVRKAGESWRVLKDEYRKGKAEAGEEEPAPRRIPHREVDPGESAPD